MKLAFVDETGLPGAFANIERAAAACEIQLSRDVPLLWQSASIPIVAFPSLSSVPKDWNLVAFLQNADVANAAGYHDRTPDGRAYSKVFVKDTLDAGFGWFDPGGVTTTASHEANEMRNSPSASWWVETSRGYLRAAEVCDLVEADCYEIDGVYVSNFLGARAFELDSSGPYDFMRLLSDPEADPRPDDYEIRWYPGQNPSPIYGAAYPEWKKKAKEHPASRTARRLARFRRP